MIEKLPHTIGNQIFPLKCGFGIGYGIGRNYQPIWVSVSVSDRNQNSGFGRTLCQLHPVHQKKQNTLMNAQFYSAWHMLHECMFSFRGDYKAERLCLYSTIPQLITPWFSQLCPVKDDFLFSSHSFSFLYRMFQPIVQQSSSSEVTQEAT